MNWACRHVAMAVGLLLAACSADSSLPRGASMTAAQCATQTGFTYVPGGDFIAGSDRAERDYAYEISAQAVVADAAGVAAAEQGLRDRRWFEFEGDRRTESNAAFCLQTNLVTQQDYAAFVAATGYRAPDISAADYQAQGFLVHPYEDVQPYRWTDQTLPEGLAAHPVVLVSYDDAIAYAQWRGQIDNATYRLPTALEWEQAARSADGRYFPWGNEWQDGATHWGQSKPVGTSAIAQYPLSRSPAGVEDMAGNVFEYTSTQRQRRGETVAVMKGCSWDDLPGFCRAAYEHTRPLDSRHILFGFRLVLVNPPETEP